ncbi:Zinc finger, RING-type [Dillenia turbinata]|uniref:Zinc finger, RING-type n=1 Tax=Dillenia turbinata TaxID=194707 RepID=A0AAN8W078_9MAGN
MCPHSCSQVGFEWSPEKNQDNGGKRKIAKEPNIAGLQIIQWNTINKAMPGQWIFNLYSGSALNDTYANLWKNESALSVPTFSLFSAISMQQTRPDRGILVMKIPVKPKAEKGLSASQLEKVPKMTGKELVLGTECAVCLDDIENDQPARVFPGCNHGFHVECADAWLSKHAVCPICRSKLGPLLENPDDNPC